MKNYLPFAKDKDVFKIKENISKMSEEEKDTVLAISFVVMEKIGDILKRVFVDKKPLTKKGEEEIESIISLGPPWLRYSRKVKRKTSR